MARPRRSAAQVISAVAEFCGSTMSVVGWISCRRFAADYTSGVAFGESTNLTARQANSIARAPLAAPFFAQRPMSYRFTMAEKEREGSGAPEATAIAAAHAIYAPFMLSFYDRLVHGFSNRFAWHCLTERLLDLYRNNLAGHHL